MSKRKFKAKVVIAGNKVFVPIPFNANDVWGTKRRHYVTGTINGHTIRGSLGSDGKNNFLPIGAAWRRDSQINTGDQVTVIITPEGPQKESLAPDVATALSAKPEVLAFFESFATFYRNTYIKWIESAKRAETRAARISEMITLLEAGRKQR